jgi:hypothetical protein
MLNTVLRIVKQAPIGKLALDVGDFALRDGKKMAPWAIPAAIAGSILSYQPHISHKTDSCSKACNHANIVHFSTAVSPKMVLPCLCSDLAIESGNEAQKNALTSS